MTEANDPMGNPADDLLGAVLDGTATAPERAQVTADPALASRLADLVAAQRALAADPPRPDPLVRARAVAAALAIADAAVADVGDEHAPSSIPPPAPVVLAARRPRQRWLAAGAAAAVLLAGLGLASVLAGNGNGDTVGGADTGREVLDASTTGGGTAADESTTSGDGDGDSGAGAPSSPAPLPATAEGGSRSQALPDLGAVDAATLPSALRALGGQDASAPPSDVVLGAPACPPPAPGASVSALASWLGTPVIVFTVAVPPARAVVVAQADCSPVAEVPLT